MAIKKLIEVALPLENINIASAREKSIRHGHPSTLHLYWARRPLAAARAVIWSSLVDDPSSHPELFPTEDDQNKERQRLFKILEDLVVWENSNDQKVLDAAKAEIMRWTDNNPPEFLDPFAGGGAIPLEAQRLGLVSHAHDLNPVSVMINKAMIEIPPKFANQPPIHPDAAKGNNYGRKWRNAEGLAEDVRYYGEWMKQEAFAKIGHLYPMISVQGSAKKTSVISWIWARTVKCPNPACECEVPLMRTAMLSKKKGKEAYVKFDYNPSLKRFDFSVVNEFAKDVGTVNRKGAVCPHCNQVVPFPYIREESCSGRVSARMMAVIAEDDHGRMYLTPDEAQVAAADVEKPLEYPQGELAHYPGHLNTKVYGLTEFHQLFTNRQLTAMVVFSDLVKQAKDKAEKDALAYGLINDKAGLAEDGLGAKAYGEAIGVYLAFIVDRLADRCSSICSWDTGYTKIRNTFGRQAIPMTWDYAEGNPFSSSTGSFESMIDWVVEVIQNVPATTVCKVSQFDAQKDCGFRNIMISTDPPYYDNIGYADLSDFFYVWLRQSLKSVYPNLFSTMLVPKADELVAIPYHFDGNPDVAKEFFENGMSDACKQLYKYARQDIPVTIYYAFKQTETNEENLVASSGWETILSAIIGAGFTITGTWPMRTEMANRSIASGANALASSIVLVCRKRPEDAPTTTRRNFIQELKRELKSSLQKLQSSNIAPVDMAQSAIGPGMGVFSKYTQVLEADGTPMSVRSALQIINQELDLYFNEQDGELDSNSRFCVDFYTQYGFNDAKFGDADTLARAKNTSVATLQSKGVIIAEKGVAHLVDRDKLTDKIESSDNMVWLFTQRLTRAMSTGASKLVLHSFITYIRRFQNKPRLWRTVCIVLLNVKAGKKRLSPITHW